MDTVIEHMKGCMAYDRKQVVKCGFAPFSGRPISFSLKQPDCFKRKPTPSLFTVDEVVRIYSLFKNENSCLYSSIPLPHIMSL